jgi:DNA-binding transcriptional LysR family regulator
MKQLLANQSRIFIAIVEAGSVTGAAERLGMGKSGVSDALKQLEHDLGVQLLMRTTRRQNLTPMGEKFYRRCKELSALSHLAIEEVNEYLAEPIGPIRITAPHATIDCAVAPAIASLIARYPRVEPELIVDDKRIDLIKHRISLALTVGDLSDSEFKARRVGRLNDVLCVAPVLYKRFDIKSILCGDSTLISDLPYVAHRWEGSEINYDLKHKKVNQSVGFRFKPIATANSVHAVLSLILKGVGVGLLPHVFLKEHLKKGNLIELLPEYEPRTSSVFAVHPFGVTPPLSVRLMIDEIRAALHDDSQ